MPQMSQEEQAIREGLDFWEVRVDRGFRGEFQAWSGTDETEAKAQFEQWCSQRHVEKVGLYVNGNLAQPIYESPRSPGRPIEREGRYVRISTDIREDLLAKIDASQQSRRQVIEAALEMYYES